MAGFDPVRDSVGPSSSGEEGRTASADHPSQHRAPTRSASIADILNDDRDRSTASSRTPLQPSAVSSYHDGYAAQYSPQSIHSPTGTGVRRAAPSYGQASVHDVSPSMIQRDLPSNEDPRGYNSSPHLALAGHRLQHSRSSASVASSAEGRQHSPSSQHALLPFSGGGGSRSIRNERSPSLLHILNSGPYNDDHASARPLSAGSSSGLGAPYQPPSSVHSPNMDRHSSRMSASGRSSSFGGVDPLDGEREAYNPHGAFQHSQFPPSPHTFASAQSISHQQHPTSIMHPHNRNASMRTASIGSNSEFAVPNVPYRSPESLRGRTSLPQTGHSPHFIHASQPQHPAQPTTHLYQHQQHSHSPPNYAGREQYARAPPVDEYGRPLVHATAQSSHMAARNGHNAAYGDGTAPSTAAAAAAAAAAARPLHISTAPPFQMPQSPAGSLPQTPYAGPIQSPMGIPPTPGGDLHTPIDYMSRPFAHASHRQNQQNPSAMGVAPNGSQSPTMLRRWSQDFTPHNLDERHSAEHEGMYQHEQQVRRQAAEAEAEARELERREAVYREQELEQEQERRREREAKETVLQRQRNEDLQMQKREEEEEAARMWEETVRRKAPLATSPLPPPKKRKNAAEEAEVSESRNAKSAMGGKDETEKKKKKNVVDGITPEAKLSAKSSTKRNGKMANEVTEEVHPSAPLDDHKAAGEGAQNEDETGKATIVKGETDSNAARRSQVPYRPINRVSVPGIVRVPITTAELAPLRGQSRNLLRDVWRAENAKQSDGWDELIAEFDAGQAKPEQSKNAGKGGVKKRKRPADMTSNAQSEAARTNDQPDMNAARVAAHYNNRQDTGLLSRKESPILGLRNYNNWVKSVLIQHFGRPKGRVLELGGGKGGDLTKWDRVRIALFVLVDIAEVSVMHARKRFEERRFTFNAEFFAGDCFGRPLDESVPRPLLEQKFDNLSLQFCLHYGWESVSRAQLMLENIARYLRAGGTFIGTMPDCEQLRRRLQWAVDADPNARGFGNDFYRVEFDDVQTTAIANGGHEGNGGGQVYFRPFGHQYRFTLADAVDNVAEYVVDWEQFESLARQNGLRCIYKKSFEELWHAEGRANDAPMRESAKRMRISVDKDIPIDEALWEASTFYVAFAFEKALR